MSVSLARMGEGRRLTVRSQHGRNEKSEQPKQPKQPQYANDGQHVQPVPAMEHAGKP